MTTIAETATAIPILYPERRVVDADTIKTWASDSYFNHAKRYRCLACGQDTKAENDCDHDEMEPVYDDGSRKPETLGECIDWLDDMGDVTFAKGAR